MQLGSVPVRGFQNQLCCFSDKARSVDVSQLQMAVSLRLYMLAKITAVVFVSEP